MTAVKYDMSFQKISPHPKDTFRISGSDRCSTAPKPPERHFECTQKYHTLIRHCTFSGFEWVSLGIPSDMKTKSWFYFRLRFRITYSEVDLSTNFEHGSLGIPSDIKTIFNIFHHIFKISNFKISEFQNSTIFFQNRNSFTDFGLRKFTQAIIFSTWFHNIFSKSEKVAHYHPGHFSFFLNEIVKI